MLYETNDKKFNKEEKKEVKGIFEDCEFINEIGVEDSQQPIFAILAVNSNSILSETTVPVVYDVNNHGGKDCRINYLNGNPGHGPRAKFYPTEGNLEYITYTIAYKSNSIEITPYLKNNNAKEVTANKYIRFVGGISLFGKDEIMDSFKGKQTDISTLGDRYNELSEAERRSYENKVIVKKAKR